VDKSDFFHGTLLESRSVQCLADWDCDGVDPREFEKILQRFLHNHTSTHGLGDPSSRNIYVIGGILNMRKSYDANRAMPVPLEESVLAKRWAENLFRRLEGLQAHYHGDVFYLGCGVAVDHSMGHFIHHFNGHLIDLVAGAQKLIFPKIQFYDIYTPANHQTWIVHNTARADWLEEPRGWIKGVSDNFRGFAIQQGVDSSKRRHKRADSRPSKTGARGSYKKTSRNSLAD
jgi:hypothetical protein